MVCCWVWSLGGEVRDGEVFVVIIDVVVRGRRG